MLKVSGSNPDGNRVLTFVGADDAELTPERRDDLGDDRRRGFAPRLFTGVVTWCEFAVSHAALACDAILRRRVHAQLSQLYASAPPTMPPALTRAASTGVDAYALFRAIDIDDWPAVPVEELLLCGAALGAQ